jgi:hypothetical protein
VCGLVHAEREKEHDKFEDGLNEVK